MLCLRPRSSKPSQCAAQHPAPRLAQLPAQFPARFLAHLKTGCLAAILCTSLCIALSTLLSAQGTGGRILGASPIPPALFCPE